MLKYEQFKEKKYPKGEIIEVPAEYKFQKSFPSQVLKLNDLVEELIRESFYGSLEIKFEAGKIVNCRKDESIKL